MRKVKRVDGIELSKLYARIEKVLLSSRLWDELDEYRRDNAFAVLHSEKQSPYDYIGLEWNRAWGVNCNLYISFESAADKDRVQVGEQYAQYVNGKVQVSWSSTNRSPASARAAINLYNEVNDLACLLEALIAETSYYLLYDLKPTQVSPEVMA